MFRWFKLVGLRMRTIAVIELEYGAKLEVAGGPDTVLFNQSTRLARDVGGNEYDAAAVFLFTDYAQRYETERPTRMDLMDMIHLTIANSPLLMQPDVTRQVIERALSPDGSIKFEFGD